jgi:hypothetical protein
MSFTKGWFSFTSEVCVIRVTGGFEQANRDTWVYLLLVLCLVWALRWHPVSQAPPVLGENWGSALLQ